MHRRIIVTGVVVLALLALSATAVFADFIENFDSYAAGSQMHGQNGWKGWDNAAGAGALVSASQAASSPNSVAITGGSDLVHQFTGATSGLQEFTAKQYIPSGPQGSSYFILMNTYNDGGPYAWSAQLNCDMTAGTIVSDNGGGASLPMVKDQWVDLKFAIDLDANSVTEYYNGQVLSTHAWYDPANGQAAVAAIDLYANNVGPVYYDNINLRAVPEPATVIMLLSVALCAALAYARKRVY